MTNENRLLADPASPIFVNPTGVGFTACKYILDLGWTSDVYAGYKLYHHIGGKYDSVLTRPIPAQNAILTVEVSEGSIGHHLVRALFMSGRVAFSKEYPTDMRMRALNLKHEIHEHMINEGDASENSTFHLIHPDAGGILRGNVLMWKPTSSPPVPNRIVRALGLPAPRPRVRAGAVIKRPSSKKVRKNPSASSSASASGIRRYLSGN
jgi:hypothetical protein